MKDITLIKRIWEFVKPYKWAFLCSYVVLLMELAFSQALPLFLEDVINYAIYDIEFTKFLHANLKYGLVFMGYAACGFVQLLLWQRLHNRYAFNIRIACYDKVLRMSPSNLSDIKTGDAIRTIQDDTEEFHHIVQRFGMRILNAGIGTIASLVIVAVMQWRIALLMCFAIPLSAIVSHKMETKMKQITTEFRNKQGEYSGWLMEILKGKQMINLFAAEETAFQRFVIKSQDIANSAIKQDLIQLKSNQIVNGIYFIVDIIFYIVCAFFVYYQSINIGEYIAIATYFSMISGNVKNILNSDIVYQKRKTSIERVLQILDQAVENEEKLVDLNVTEGRLEFDNLSFSYVPEKSILNNLNVSINPGERIGIVGQSGVGKSTLVSLILRLYEPQQGEIRIDGQPLSKCKYSSIRQNVGIMSQDCILFDTTIRENITLGMPASDDQLWSVLEQVFLKDTVEALPNKLDTRLGEHGIALSGGQNQRLCIARLIFRDPKIIILDEATSALDPQSEVIVQAALDSLSRGKTTLVISHRYQSLLQTNRILVLNDGSQVAFDHHDILIKENKHFSDMFGKYSEVHA